MQLQMGLFDTLKKTVGIGEDLKPGSMGDAQNREIVDAYISRVEENMNPLEDGYEKLSDEELAAKTEMFRARLAKGETEDDILDEVRTGSPAIRIHHKRAHRPLIAARATSSTLPSVPVSTTPGRTLATTACGLRPSPRPARRRDAPPLAPDRRSQRCARRRGACSSCGTTTSSLSAAFASSRHHHPTPRAISCVDSPDQHSLRHSPRPASTASSIQGVFLLTWTSVSVKSNKSPFVPFGEKLT